MKVWVLTELWDDSDPGDKASLSRVQVFGSEETAKAAFLKVIDGYYPDVDLDDVSNDIDPKSECVADWDEVVRWAHAQGPEGFTWLSRARDDGWDGGYVVELTEAEMEP